MRESLMLPFPGTVNKVEIDVQPANLSMADQKKVDLAMIQALLARR